MMAKVLFEVDVRRPVKLYEKLVEQQPRRVTQGETSFSMHIDDNARHVAYVFLDWASLTSAHDFLNSPVSHELVAEWPIEKVLGAIPLRDYSEDYNRLLSSSGDA
jgi:hypothetical protein